MVPRHSPSLLPVVVLLIVGLIAFYPALKTCSPLQELLRETPKARITKPTLKVWVNRRSGLYYCPQSDFYGKTQPGFYVTQEEAVQNGYRPAAGEACKDNQAQRQR